MKKILLITAVCFFAALTLQAQIENTSYTTQYGEKVLQLSITVPISKQEAWKLFTTHDGLKKWLAPVVMIDMRTGGFIRSNYDSSKTLEDSSSIQLDIINYIEYQMLTLKVTLNNNFPMEARNTDKNLQEILEFRDAGNGNTKIISSMIGWGSGDAWNKTYDFFVRGNEWTFEEILKLFKK